MTTLLNQIIQHEGEHAIYGVNPNFPDAESNGWKWKKYQDGFCEMWGRFSFDNSPYAEIYNGYYPRQINFYFPFTLTSYGGAVQDNRCGNGYTISQFVVANTTSIRSVFLSSSSGSQYCYTSLYVWGRWK